MGFLDNLGRHVENRQRRERKRGRVFDEYQQGGKLYRIISTVAIIGLFLAVGLLVVGIMQRFMSAGLCLFLAILAILCLCATLALYWVRFLEKKVNVKLSIAMLALLGLAAVLWTAVAIVVYSMYVQGKAGTLGEPRARMVFIQIALITAFQIFEALLIASTWVKYKKSYLVFQIIMYISNLFVDFWFSVLFSCFNFTGTGSEVFALDRAAFLTSPGMITTLVLFIVYTIICNSVLRSIEQRRIRNIAHDEYNMDDDVEPADAVAERVDKATAKKNATPEEKLSNLKDLLEKGLITEEEYKEKKAKIIDEM